MNKSEEVRKLLAEQPNIMPIEAVRVLADRGVSITPAFFSTMKSNAKKKAKKSKKRSNGVAAPAAPAAPRVRSDEQVTVSSLLSAKRFVAEVGGIPQARSAVNVLERIL